MKKRRTRPKNTKWENRRKIRRRPVATHLLAVTKPGREKSWLLCVGNHLGLWRHDKREKDGDADLALPCGQQTHATNGQHRNALTRLIGPAGSGTSMCPATVTAAKVRLCSWRDSLVRHASYLLGSGLSWQRENVMVPSNEPDWRRKKLHRLPWEGRVVKIRSHVSRVRALIGSLGLRL